MLPIQAFAYSDNAKKLEAINKQIKTVEILMQLDDVDDYINKPFRCGKKASVLRKLKNRLRILNDDFNKGRISSTNYNATFDSLNIKRKQALTTFNECFYWTLKAAGEIFPDALALKTRTWKEMADAYDRLTKRYYTIGIGFPKGELKQLRLKRNRFIRNADNVVAIFSALTKDTVRLITADNNRAVPAYVGMIISAGDTIVTNRMGFSRIYFLSKHISGMGSIQFDIQPNSEIKITKELAMSKLPWKREVTLMDVFKGTARALFQGWRRSSVFSVRAGTTVCGIRGTDIEISYSPKDKQSHFKLYSGRVEIRTPIEKFYLDAGNEVSVTGRYRGTIRKINAAPPM